MLSAKYLCLAATAMAATILSSAPGNADPLAMTDTGFPFGSIFQQVVRDPAPQAMPEESTTEQPAGPVDERFRRQIVSYNTAEQPGTIVIDTPHTYLYYVLGQGRAIRYGIGVGRDGFRWSGVQTVANKQEWPDWHPPAEMIARQPYLPRMMAGGPGNPLGARAMYLGSSEYRIHGTNAPDTIGKRVSSGCIRLINADVEDLYSRVTSAPRSWCCRTAATAPKPLRRGPPNIRRRFASSTPRRWCTAPTPSRLAAPTRFLRRARRRLRSASACRSTTRPRVPRCRFIRIDPVVAVSVRQNGARSLDLAPFFSLDRLRNRRTDMKIAAMAAGAVGAYFGGRMQAAGHDVAYIARRAHLEALRKDGLKIESVHGDLHLPKVNATDDPKQVGPVDIVLFAVKLWDTETAAELAKPLVGPNTRVITLQNGVDSYERVSGILGKEQTCPGTAYIAAVLGGPGVMRHTSKFATMRVGRMDGKPDAKLAAFVEAAKAAQHRHPAAGRHEPRALAEVHLPVVDGRRELHDARADRQGAGRSRHAKVLPHADGGVPRGRPDLRRQGAGLMGRRPHDIFGQRASRHEGLDVPRP